MAANSQRSRSDYGRLTVVIAFVVAVMAAIMIVVTFTDFSLVHVAVVFVRSKI